MFPALFVIAYYDWLSEKSRGNVKENWVVESQFVVLAC